MRSNRCPTARWSPPARRRTWSWRTAHGARTSGGTRRRSIEAAQTGAIVWCAWPKRTSGLETDLTRDEGWDALTSAGLRGVATVAIDDTWSGLRFRPVEDVRPRP